MLGIKHAADYALLIRPTVLDAGYVPSEYMPAARQVLKACAFTYVAAALADILSIWRGLSVLR
jgi:Zn-dependent membrane protease YugP